MPSALQMLAPGCTPGMNTRIVLTMFSTNTMVAITRATLLPRGRPMPAKRRGHAEHEGRSTLRVPAPALRAMIPGDDADAHR